MYDFRRLEGVLLKACRGILISPILYSVLLILKQYFKRLQNYYSIIAIGQGLYTTGFQPSELLQTQSLLNLEANFAAYRELMIKYPGLPFLLLKSYDLEKSRRESGQLYKIFRFVKYFRKKYQEETNGESRILYRKIRILLYTFSISYRVY